MTDLIEEQQELINYFFDHFERDQVSTFSSLILEVSGSSGVIYFSGMGKSGLIARNISQMLVSIGIRAMYLSPVDALHGDLGVLTNLDMLVLLSRSGQTEELLNLLSPTKSKGCRIVTITSNRDSLMANSPVVSCSIYLPIHKELCPFDLAPTTSSVIQLLFGNIVVVDLMRRTNLTRAQYALNHPAGRIGKRLTLRVQDVMRKLEEVPLSSATDRLIDAIPKISSKGCGCLLIVDQLKLLGIFTDGDLRRTIEKDGSNTLYLPMKAHMNAEPFCCREDQMAFECMQEMERDDPDQSKKRIKEMPVLNEEHEVVGLLTLHELVRAGL